jgi:predicted permease
VSDDFFHVLGVQPAIGRAFLDGEQQPNGPRVAILSHGLWQRAMGGRMDAIDRQITLNDRDYTVVGVMPGDFTYEPQPDVIVPLQMAVNPANIGLNYTILGLLAPNLTVESAQPDMERVFQQYQSENPGHLSKQMVGASVGLVQDHLTAPYRPVFTILLAAAGLVLLIVCANVTNLLLSRGAVRRREMAIRTALGASRGRLVGHVMAESLLLALAGGVCSLLLAFWGVRVLLALSPSGIPRLASVGLDGRVLLFAAVVSVVSGLACGAMGSLRLARTGPGEALKASASAGGPDRSRQRLSSALVVAEVAISAILLTGAALLIVTYFNLRSLRPGFDPENLLVVEYPLTSQRYATAERIVGFESSLLEEVRALPGVLSATAASGLPFQRGLNHVAVIEGRADEEWQLIEYRAVGPEYFSTLGIPVLQGRGIEASDIAAGPPIVVVNQRMARIIDGGRGALGERITIGKRTSSTDVTRDVVGVVADIADGPPGVPALPTVYVPRGQSGMLGSRSFSATLIRVRPFADVAASVRHAIGALDPTLPIVSIRPLSEVAAAALAPQRFNMTLIGAFAGAALLLTIVGLYGLLSYGVTQRTREIGLRVALGAARGRVVGMVLRRGMTLSLAGTVLGVAGALGLSRFMSSLLFGVSGTSFTVFAAVVIALLGLAMMATLVPAVRATRIEPNVALRTD